MGTYIQPFDPDEFEREYGFTSPLAHREWEEFEKRHAEGVEAIMARMGLVEAKTYPSTVMQLTDSADLLPEQTQSYGDPSLLGNESPLDMIKSRVGESLLLLNPPEDVMMESRERLEAAAKYWKIEGYQNMDDALLEAALAAKRESVARPELGWARQFGLEEQLFTNAIKIAIGEGIESIPFIGRDLGQLLNVNEAQDWLRQLNEGIKASLPAEYLEKTQALGLPGVEVGGIPLGIELSKNQIIEGSGTLVGWLVPGVGWYKAAAFAGRATGLANAAARMSPIQRAALGKFAQGATATWGMVAMGNKPREEKALEIIAGGALDVGLEVGGPLLAGRMKSMYQSVLNKAARRYHSTLLEPGPGLETGMWEPPPEEYADWSFVEPTSIVPSSIRYTGSGGPPGTAGGLFGGGVYTTPDVDVASLYGQAPPMGLPSGVPRSLPTPPPVRGLLPAGDEYIGHSRTRIDTEFGYPQSKTLRYSSIDEAIADPLVDPVSLSSNRYLLATGTIPPELDPIVFEINQRRTLQEFLLNPEPVELRSILQLEDYVATEIRRFEARKNHISTTPKSYAQWVADKSGTVARDANGMPVLLYHGTGYAGEFNAMLLGNEPQGNLFGAGLYHTTNPAVASGYAEGKGPDLWYMNDLQGQLDEIDRAPDAFIRKEELKLHEDINWWESRVSTSVEDDRVTKNAIADLQERIQQLRTNPEPVLQSGRAAIKAQLDQHIANAGQPNVRQHYLSLRQVLRLDDPLDFDEARMIIEQAQKLYPEWAETWGQFHTELEDVSRRLPQRFDYRNEPYKALQKTVNLKEDLTPTDLYNSMIGATYYPTGGRVTSPQSENFWGKPREVFGKQRMTHLLMTLGYDGLHHVGGRRVGQRFGDHDVYIAWYPDAIIPANMSKPLPSRMAKAEAEALTKQNQIVNSEGLPSVVGKSELDDADLVQLVADNNPAGINIVHNVSLTAESLEALSQKAGPLYYEYVTAPDGSFDILTSRAPIPKERIAEYEATGLYTGQQVTTANGRMGSVKIPSSGTVVLQHPVYPNLTFKVRRKNVLPTTVGMQSVEAPGLYQEFRTQVEDYMREESGKLGIDTPDWLDVETSGQLPYLMDQFFAKKGIDPLQQDPLRIYFDQQRVRDFALLVPEDVAAAVNATEALDRARYYGSFEGGGPDVYDKATGKGFIWVTDPGAASGTLHDQFSNLKIPVEDEGAADEFLKAFEREVGDGTPITDVPFEVAPSLEFGNDIPKAGTHESFVEELGESIVVLEQELADAANDLGGVPPGSPPPPTDFGLGGPGPLGGGRKSMFEVDDLQKLLDRYTGIRFSLFRNTRQFWQRMQEDFRTRGVDFDVWGRYEKVEANIERSQAEAYPWHLRKHEIFRKVRNRHLRSGDFQRIHEISGEINRMTEAMRVGFNDEELQSLIDYNNLMDDFFTSLYGPHNGLHRRVTNFTAHLRAMEGQKQTSPYFAGSPLPPQLKWVDDLFKGNELHMRQMNAETLSTMLIRQGFFNKHVTPDLDVFLQLANDAGVDPKISALMKDWARVVTRGYDIESSKVTRGLHSILGPSLGLSKSEVGALSNIAMGWTHMGALGYKPRVWFRDAIQPLFSAIKGSTRVLGRVYKDYAKGGQLANDMERRAVEGGWMEIGHAPIETHFSDDVLMPGEAPHEFIQALSPGQKARREATLAIYDFFGDRLGRKFDLHGKFGPLGVYQKQGAFQRMVSGEMGYRLATKANRKLEASLRIRAGVGTEADRKLLGRRTDYTKEQYLGDSRLRTMNPVVGDKAWRLASSGQYEEAALLGAREFAYETQFMYGVRQLPPAGRSMDGRMAYQFGTYTIQLSNMMLNGVRYGTLADKAKFIIGMGGIAAGLEKLSEVSGWNFSDWIWYKAFGWAGGPAVETAVETFLAATGAASTMVGEEGSPLQQTAMRTIGRQGASFASLFNPLRGAIGTPMEYLEATKSENPIEAMLRTTVTGDVGTEVDYERWLKTLGEEALYQIGQPLPQQPSPPGAGGR